MSICGSIRLSLDSDTWDQAKSDLAIRGIKPSQISKVKAILTLLHPTFSETELGGDALSTCALPKQQQNLVADFRRNFLAHKNVPRKCLAFWGQFKISRQFFGFCLKLSTAFLQRPDLVDTKQSRQRAFFDSILASSSLP